MTELKTPFPWFGGKRRVASEVWKRFGEVRNYVEPFFGSGAVLLNSPTIHRFETINDLDGFVANFWRAVKNDPEGVAKYADNPVNEADLSARHLRLVELRPTFLDRMACDPDYYDSKIAGWWVWGICCWIGRDWCTGNGPWSNVNGVLAKAKAAGVNRQLPHLGDAGQGVNRNFSALEEYISSLSARLRGVRVCCGDWKRVLGKTPTTKLGTTGVFLDPPYSFSVRDKNLYREDSTAVSSLVREWALENASDPKMRIALCGYEGEHTMPDDWSMYSWSSPGAYMGASKSGGTVSRRHLERIWFSPNCLNDEE